MVGFPIPVSEGSVLGKIDDIHCDIGDEQSIEQNLSTFSAQVAQRIDADLITLVPFLLR